MDMKEIREAVTANRGGLEGASDNEILRIWSTLDKTVQEKYQEKIKRKEKNAVSTGAKSKNQDSPGNGQKKA